MEWKNKKVLVVGSGISGIGAATLLHQVGAVPIIFDKNESLSVTDIWSKFIIDIKPEIILGTFQEEMDDQLDLVVLSPGVPTDLPFIKRLRDKKIKIWGEIELGFAFEKGKVTAITGTNGKTTTTTLVGKMADDYFGNPFIVGNIGKPYTLTAGETTSLTHTVAEISSFQLETIENFKPDVSAILNITPDHLNRHYTMENYVDAKLAIAKNQTKEDICVLNYENSYTREFADKCPAKVVFFSSENKLEEGFYLWEDFIWQAQNGQSQKLIAINEIHLVGACNYENIMAALAMGQAMNIPMKNLLDTVRNFHAVEHRIEFVANKKGVDYYNDSKGTNPDAAIQGIRAMTKPTILIGGGYDKGSQYDEWIDAFGDKVKALILIGQTRDAIAQCAREHGFTNIVFAENLEEVVNICQQTAGPGDAVLLSPACASWGMFPNYEVRGTIFKNLVHSIKE